MSGIPDFSISAGLAEAVVHSQYGLSQFTMKSRLFTMDGGSPVIRRYNFNVLNARMYGVHHLVLGNEVKKQGLQFTKQIYSASEYFDLLQDTSF